MIKRKYIYTLAFVAVFFIGIHSLSAIKLSYESNELSLSDVNKNEIADNNLQNQNKKGIAADLFMDLSENDLPVSDVAVHPVENPEGVVVFIPQTHINPGTRVEDPINDSAEAAQKEIYEIIDYLNENEGVDFIMVEGEKFGLVPDDKIAGVEKKISIRNNLLNLSNELKNELKNESVTREEIDSMMYALENEIKYLDREIALSGAPYEAKAENKDIVVYGSENPGTYQECSKIVTNYIYQKDRLSVLEGANNQATGKLAMNDKLAQLKALLENKHKNTDSGNANANAAMDPNLDSVKNIYSSLLDSSINISDLILKQRGGLFGNASLDESLDEIKLIGESGHNQNIIDIANGISACDNELEQLRNEKNTTTGAASRSDNPYNNINDKEVIKEEIKESEDQIQEMVIDKRNRETAENFKQALLETNNNVGILQFGAGHEKGLIEQMNAKNLTVVVVKSNEVFSRASE